MKRVKRLFFQFVHYLLLFALGSTYVVATPASIQAAAAATFTVNSTADAADANPGDGRCATSIALRAQCTLRAAIQEANAHNGADTIVLAAQTYALSLFGFDVDANANTGDLDLTDPAGVTIQGNGATISSNQRTFHIHAAATATFNNLTIRTSPQAIFNQGTLTVSNSRILGNERVQATQPRYPVSGIESAGALRLTNVTLDGLVAGATGQIAIQGVHTSPTTSTLNGVTVQNGRGPALVIGGADNVVEITNTTLANNLQGMVIDGANTVTVRRSTLHNHQSSALVIGAGAVEFPLQVKLFNTTLSGNQGGPALRLNTSDSRRLTVRLNNVTITNNAGNNTPGGILAPQPTNNLPSPVLIGNSIIAGNRTGGNVLGIEPNCSGPLTAFSTNMISFSASIGACVINGDNRNETPALEPLAENGGPTLTHALAAGSSAIDEGNVNLPGTTSDACEPEDQTGKVRPQGAFCDLGAVEVPGVLGRPFIVTSIAPTSTLAVSGPFSVTVRGEGFQSDTIVRRNGNQQFPTTFVSANEVIAAFPEMSSNGDDGLMGIAVFDPTTGQFSNGVPFLLLNPRPVPLSLSPQKVRAGIETLVTVTGEQLSPFTNVQINGGELEPTIFISSTQLIFRVPAALAQTPGEELDVLLVTRPPGGGPAANVLKLLVVDSPGVGIGAIDTNVQSPIDLSTMTLGWVHPEDWRKLKSMSVNIIDGTSNTVVAGVGFLEEYGDKGVLVTLDGNGNVTGMGFPGEETQLDTPIGRLDLNASQINAVPGTTVEVVYVFQFNAAAAGRTFSLAMTAGDKNGDDHGFEAAGTISVPATLFLPLVSR